MEKDERKLVIEDLKAAILKAIASEWGMQGHNMSGKAMSSMEARTIEDNANSLTIDFLAPGYVGILNAGVTADKIPFSPGSGAKHSLYIDGLMRFAMKRMGLDEKAALGVAFAIAHTQKREGMPTRGSFAFSSTGKRTGFVEVAIDKEMPLIQDYINKLFDNVLQTTIEIIMKENKQWR